MSEPSGSETQPSALEGLRVLDLGLIVQGPQAGQVLADLGAEVIKVEQPGIGDHARWIPLEIGDFRSPYYYACNRGKRGITLDLRVPAGRDVLLRLAETADVLISNFVPGTLDRWGLDYATLAERNPRLVYATGSTYGPLGPDAGERGADIAGQAASGLLLRTGPAEATPIGATIVDAMGSQSMVNGILAALLARERTGRGQRVDVSLVGSALFAQASEITWTALTGRNPGEVDRGHPIIPHIYGLFPTADGFVAIVGVYPEARAPFFELLGLPELTDDERFIAPFLPPEVRHELFDRVDPAFRQRTTAEWVEALRAIEIRCAPARDYTELLQDPGVFENGYLTRVEHPEWGALVAPGSPICLSDTPARPGQLAPELGQHTEEVLLELGLSWDEIGALREAGAI
jgi:formyl-CoA transferase/CoA:oxalate CoA-transferase